MTTKLDNRLIVEKVQGGYRVVRTKGEELVPVNAKVYFHPTSAYAALGRIAHVENLKGLPFKNDPAKAPAKEPASDASNTN